MGTTYLQVTPHLHKISEHINSQQNAHRFVVGILKCTSTQYFFRLTYCTLCYDTRHGHLKHGYGLMERQLISQAMEAPFIWTVGWIY